MPYVFLDESGQFAKDGENKYFVVASFTVGNPSRTEKQFRHWQREKFPKVMRDQPEIKFSQVDIDAKLRLKTLRFISRLDVRIHYSFLDRHNIPKEYRQKGSQKSGDLYTSVVGQTIKPYAALGDVELRIFCDRRHLKNVSRTQFRDKLTAQLLPLMPNKSIVQVEMLDSTENANIQIADWIAGALAGFVNGKQYGEEYRQILSGNILSGSELFKDSWLAHL